MASTRSSLDEPDGDVWTPRPWVHPSLRREQARAARARVPRTQHASLDLRADRDPFAILAAQEADRLPALLPLRHQRMAESAFAYYRGTPAVMAFDLANTPRTDLVVQASGDAHISNFGVFGSPEGQLVFDANDFDETMPAPWEWDVKRLAASVVIAARDNGFADTVSRAATIAAVRSYRDWMTRYAAMDLIDVSSSKLTAADIIHSYKTGGVRERGADVRAGRSALEAFFAHARRHDRVKAAKELTRVVDGRRIILDDPPVIRRSDVNASDVPALARVFDIYRSTLPENRRLFLERYRFADIALKVVGVGSVGTRCYVLVLEGRDENDVLLLQVKEATASVLAPHYPLKTRRNHGERVVLGQRLMQATPDIFLGWTRGPDGRDFYLRQLWDMKGSADIAAFAPRGLAWYSAMCARALALAHARTGDAVAISAYLGSGGAFPGAVADFAEAYAVVNARDHAAYRAAIESGALQAAPSAPSKAARGPS